MSMYLNSVPFSPSFILRANGLDAFNDPLFRELARTVMIPAPETLIMRETELHASYFPNKIDGRAFFARFLDYVKDKAPRLALPTVDHTEGNIKICSGTGTLAYVRGVVSSSSAVTILLLDKPVSLREFAKELGWTS